MADSNKLIIKIGADVSDFKKGVAEATSDAKSKFKAMGDELTKELKRVDSVGTTAFKGVLGAAGAVATGATALIGGVVKDSISAWATYEQLIGGVETIFGNSADKVKAYAQEAYKNAGVSANTYMEMVTGFSASLLQSLGNDTNAAAEYADRAMRNMSDNANKMGTAIGSIQWAYQGFAKQNYTMLDNLKLGYGGTQEEMERLIADAATYTEQQNKLNVSVNEGDMSFGNIVNAIAVVQEKLGFTNTTIDEAGRTISGSMGSITAAWENLQVALVRGDNIDEAMNVFISTLTNTIKNYGPKIEVALAGLGRLIYNALPALFKSSIPTIITDLIPGITNAAINLIEIICTVLSQNIGKVVDFIGETVPTLVDTGVKLVGSILDGLTSNLDSVKETAVKVVDKLAEGIRGVMEKLYPIAGDIVGALLEGFITYKALTFEMGVKIITAIAEGLAESAPTLGPEIVNTLLYLVDILIENMPTFLESVITIITELANSLWERLPEILAGISTIIHNLLTTLIETIDQWLPALLQVVGSIVSALLVAIGALLVTIIQKLVEWWNSSVQPKLDFAMEIIKGCWEMIKQDWQTFKEDLWAKITSALDKLVLSFTNLKTKLEVKLTAIKNSIVKTFEDAKEKVRQKISDFVNIGSNLVQGIADGISNAKQKVMDKVQELFNLLPEWARNLLGIESPSKVFAEIGRYTMAGFAEGMLDQKGSVQKALDTTIGGLNTNVGITAGLGSQAYLTSAGGNQSTTTTSIGDINVYTSAVSSTEVAVDIAREVRRKVRYAGGLA